MSAPVKYAMFTGLGVIIAFAVIYIYKEMEQSQIEA